MKKNIFMMLVILVTTYANSQTNDFICATPDNDDPDPIGVYSKSIDSAVLNSFETVVYNIYFWGINRDDGTSDNKLNETKALEAVASLNIAYNQFNIFFKYRGYDYINNTDYYISPGYTGSNSIFAYAEDYGFVHENSFNIYIPYLFEYGYSGIGRYNRTTIAINAGALDDVKLEHEMGHNFNLKHTFYGCERVTRDPNDPLFDADIAGDLVVDTPAQSHFNPGQGYPDIDTTNCSYIGNEQNCHQENYEIFPIDVQNIMGYTPLTCRNNLTPGQGIRMQEAITDDIYGEFLDAETIIPSLYEPYSGEYYNAGPFDPVLHKPLFQPGFEYRFIECSGTYPQPADYYDTSFSYNSTLLSVISRNETDYNTITHPNHSAIWIKQQINNVQVFPQPRKCYNNYNKKPSGGKITKFNDDVLNTNVTITVQDSTAINNPNLINNLDSGLYKVEKTYNDGSTQETVIYKGNN